MEEREAVETGGDDRAREPVRAEPIAGELVTQMFAYDGGREVTVYLPADPRRRSCSLATDSCCRGGAGTWRRPICRRRSSSVLTGPTTTTRWCASVSTHRRSTRDASRPTRDFRRRRPRLGPLPVRCRASPSAHRGLRRLGERGAGARARSTAPRHLRCGLLRLAWWGYRPPHVFPRMLPRAYLVAGTLEPFFLENATRWADALRDAGADVVMAERVGDHGDPFWQAEFVRMVGWLFGS